MTLRSSARRYTPWLRRATFPGSRRYWERRYAEGGNSGAGSYGATSLFKAEVLNGFVAAQGVASVIEFGCGDGHQLSLARYPRYIGLDVSSTAVRACIEQYKDDHNKSFLWYRPEAFVNHGALVAELALSLDVIYHLVEDEAYDKYMSDLFGSATQYVAIFSMNEEGGALLPPHMKFRRFTDWVVANAPDWTLSSHVVNPDKGPHSLADFYFFSKLSRLA